MLGRRGKDTEHSAMRKLKNEFMASWDGLRTRERERVLVLAATNRPFDLDDAVIRRFPRRSLLFIGRLFFHLLSMESLEFQSKP
jgi:SpoVK/Ycf46/Vps4 family AAA+-type ATPase